MSNGTEQCAKCHSKLKIKRTYRNPASGKLRRVFECTACGWRTSKVIVDKVAASMSKILSAKQAGQIEKRAQRIASYVTKARPPASFVSFKGSPAEDEFLIRRIKNQCGS